MFRPGAPPPPPQSTAPCAVGGALLRWSGPGLRGRGPCAPTSKALGLQVERVALRARHRPRPPAPSDVIIPGTGGSFPPPQIRLPGRVLLKGGGSKGGWVGGAVGGTPPAPAGGPELLKAPKVPKKFFGLN